MFLFFLYMVNSLLGGSCLRCFGLVNQLSFLMTMHLAQLLTQKDLSKCHFYFLSLNLEEQDR